MPTFITTMFIMPIILTLVVIRVIPKSHAATVLTYVYLITAIALLVSMVIGVHPPVGWSLIALLGFVVYALATALAVIVGSGTDHGFVIPWLGRIFR